MAISKPLFAIWLLTLAGGVVLIGAVAALTSDVEGPFPDAYRLVWTAISLEVATLLVALYALASGNFPAWKHTVTAMLATITAVLVPITNLVLELKSDLPGSNGSDTRANTATAGLIIVMFGNYAFMLGTAIFGGESSTSASADIDGADGKVAV